MNLFFTLFSIFSVTTLANAETLECGISELIAGELESGLLKREVQLGKTLQMIEMKKDPRLETTGVLIGDYFIKIYDQGIYELIIREKQSVAIGRGKVQDYAIVEFPSIVSTELSDLSSKNRFIARCRLSKNSKCEK